MLHRVINGYPITGFVASAFGRQTLGAKWSADIKTIDGCSPLPTKTKSLLPSLYKREESPSLAIFFLPIRQARGDRGDFQKRCLFNYGLLSPE